MKKGAFRGLVLGHRAGLEAVSFLAHLATLDAIGYHELYFVRVKYQSRSVP